MRSPKSDSFFRNHHLLIKLSVISILTALLLGPMSMIENTIADRMAYQQEASGEITKSWGSGVTLGAPVLTVPVVLKSVDGKGDTTREYHDIHLLPDELDADVNIEPEIRYRGIFKVPVYVSQVTIKGRFVKPDFSAFMHAEPNVLWEKAFVSMYVPDPKSIKGGAHFKWNGEKRALSPGVHLAKFLKSGIHVPLSMSEWTNERQAATFEFSLRQSGSEKFQLIPMAANTRVQMASSWPAPNFIGRHLPDNRQIDHDGFKATWEIPKLARNFPQWERNNGFKMQTFLKYAFGVNLEVPADHYLISMRSAKYAILFIGLTFLSFFAFEIFLRIRIHPLQYLQVGFANTLFYLLLLSFSEHIGFTWAYLVASSAVIALVGFYCWNLLQTGRNAVLIVLLQTSLFGYLYVLLRMENYSLISGSVGLFIILAIFMSLTRKVDWYALSAAVSNRQAAPANSDESVGTDGSNQEGGLE